MEEKYGKKEGVLKTLPIAEIGPLVVGILFLIAAVAVLWHGIVGGSVAIGPFVLCLIFGIAFLGYAIYIMTKCTITMHETAMVVRTLTKTLVFPIDQMLCILWDFPGAAQGTSMGPRKNTTSAEVVMQHGQKGYKISDGYYGNVSNILGPWQTAHKIKREL